MSEPTKTLDQRRADHAWKALDAFLNPKAHLPAWGKVDAFPIPTADNPACPRPDDKAKGKYGVHVRRLPVRVMSSGLGQALAFLLAKNYCPDLLTAIGHWVLYQRNEKTPPKPAAPDTLLLAVIGGDSELLQLCTAETLAYLRWMTRFVEAKKADLFPKGTVTDEVV